MTNEINIQAEMTLWSSIDGAVEWISDKILQVYRLKYIADDPQVKFDTVEFAVED